MSPTVQEPPIECLEGFNFKSPRIRKFENATLAPVFLLDEQIVLRARTNAEAVIRSFETECVLLEELRPLLGVQLPRYLKTKDGTNYLMSGGHLWTAHNKLIGKTLGNWFELHLLDDGIHKRVFRFAHEMHSKTRGKLGLSNFKPKQILEMTNGHIEEFRNQLSARSRGRLIVARERLGQFASNITSQNAVFVHGDFHIGNLLLNENNTVNGVIDLDWARVGHQYDDLAFTIAMLLRDYDRWDPTFRVERFLEVASWYGVPNNEMAVLSDYVLTYSLFDCFVFSGPSNKDGRFLQFQFAFLDSLAQNI